MPVVSFINYQGGTHASSLCRLALDLWKWCLRRKSFLQAAHIPGEETIVVNFLSRGKYLPSEWVLNHSVFQKICLASSPPPEIDLFASTLNFRLPKYCSRCPDAQAWRIDALSISWTDLHLYTYPPVSLLPGSWTRLPRTKRTLSWVLCISSEALVSLTPTVFGRSSKGVAIFKGHRGTTPVSDASSQCRKSSSFSMASLRQQGEDAGISQRAAQFSAEAFRQFTRDTYDTRLEDFREVCAKIP